MFSRKEIVHHPKKKKKEIVLQIYIYFIKIKQISARLQVKHYGPSFSLCFWLLFTSYWTFYKETPIKVWGYFLLDKKCRFSYLEHPYLLQGYPSGWVGFVKFLVIGPKYR